MSLGKQAKILTDAQQQAVLAYLEGRRNGERDTIMFLLSVDAGVNNGQRTGHNVGAITGQQGLI